MTNDKADSEDAIIGGYWAPLAEGFAGAFGLKDDCALIAPPAGCDLVVTTDAVVAGVHFFPDEDPGAVAWKALAVNVSDLVAKGAEPLAYLMTVAFPAAPERAWLADFTAGLARAQQHFGCHLAGGDTDRTPGPLSVSITAIGSVPKGRMVRRSTAQAGDLVYVSGTIGDAALGLDRRRERPAQSAQGTDIASEGSRLDTALSTPQPPIALAPVVRDFAAAAMDVSDGLVKDFTRMCAASAVGGRIEAPRVPLSEAARAVLSAGDATLERLITGGEDYQVLAALRPASAPEFERGAAAAGVAVTCIGSIEDASAGVSVLGADGRPLALAAAGWDHFHKKV